MKQTKSSYITNLLALINNTSTIVASFMRYQVDKHGTKNYSLSLFIAINYLIPILIIGISGNFLYDSVVYLRFISIFLCLGLLFLEYWPKEIKAKWYPFYWYFCLFFCISFVTSYTIFITYNSEFWILNAALSILLLFIVTDWISFTALMLLGSVFGYLFYMALSYKNDFHYIRSDDIFLIFYLYGFLFVIMFLFIRDKEKIQEKKLRNMELFGGAIAHEVNTPIATAQIVAMTLSDIMSDVAKGAKKINNKDGTISYRFTVNQYEKKLIFENLPQDLLRTTREARKVIDVLLMLLKHRGSEGDATYSMKDVVKEVLLDYDLDNNKIHFRKNNDFRFFGTKQYMKQVIKNLLNNAIKYAGDNPQINIWIDNNSLYIRDNGTGISPEYIQNLFKPFHEKNAKGCGIGLAFCSILIQNMGGTISCESEYGKYTQFRINLPALR